MTDTNQNEDFLSRVSSLPTPRQEEIIRVLEETEKPGLLFSQWYKGAIHVSRDSRNPDRFSQAAQSLREILEKLPWVILETERKSNANEAISKRKEIEAAFKMAKEECGNSWLNKVVNNNLENVLNMLGQYLELNQRPSRRENVIKSLAFLDPFWDRLEREKQEAFLSKYKKAWNRLEDYAHHSSGSEDEAGFKECLNLVEEIIFEKIVINQVTREQVELLKLINKWPQ